MKEAQNMNRNGQRKFTHLAPPGDTYMTLSFEPAKEKYGSTMAFSNDDPKIHHPSKPHSHFSSSRPTQRQFVNQEHVSYQNMAQDFPSYHKEKYERTELVEKSHSKTNPNQMAHVVTYYSSYEPEYNSTSTISSNNNNNNAPLYSDSVTNSRRVPLYNNQPRYPPSHHNPQVMASEVDPVPDADWKQAFQYAKEFGFEIPVKGKRGEPSPVREDDIRSIKPDISQTAQVASKSSSFYNILSSPQFDTKVVDQYNSQQQQPASQQQQQLYNPTVADSNVQFRKIDPMKELEGIDIDKIIQTYTQLMSEEGKKQNPSNKR